jgi:hypothetical protein
MSKLLRSRTFWFGFVLGFVLMLALGIYQAGWLSFFLYPSAWGEIVWSDPALLFAVVIAFLVGLNFGGFLYVTRCTSVDEASQPGFFGFLGATAAWFAIHCIACQATLFTVFGVAVLSSSVAPYVPYLKFASVILLIVSLILILRKAKNPHCRLR